MRIVRPTTGLFAGAGALSLLVAWLSIPPTPSDAGTTPVKAAATVTVRGVVFYDENDNGVREPGEPGVAGIAIHDKAGNLSTLTGADGSYTLSGLPTSGYLQIETGWFRSQCPSAANPTANSCTVGPGADNDYAVDNQFLRHTLTAKNASNVDVGIVPDWPGRSMTIPAPVGGVVPANPVDVGARLSWISGTCVGGAYDICRAGDTFTLAGQILNQGTTALTGIRARIYVPPGDCVTAAVMMGDTVPAGLGALTVTPPDPTCADRYLDASLDGSLAPAAGVRILISGRTASGPGTPGCLVSTIDKKLCPTAEPQGHGWLFGISHIDQTGDPDSTFCAAGDMTVCAIGLHDKRRAPDEIDPAGHNVVSSLAGSTVYDLVAHAEMLDPTTVRAFVGNARLQSVDPGVSCILNGVSCA